MGFGDACIGQHDAHGEEPKAAHHAAARPRDDETDIQQTKIRMYF